MSTRSPVLFLVFNRPDTTQRVFDAIRASRPPRLYVAADGARKTRPAERDICAEVRRIATAVDWDCSVRTLFSEDNLGCKIAVSNGISWFFENEEEGIILEDDCLPSADFFEFTDSLLQRYRADANICAISGTQFDSATPKPTDYYYSKYPLMWGWAAWRRSWIGYRRSIPAAEIEKYFSTSAKKQFGLIARLYLKRQILGAASGKIDTWDYQWIYHCISHDRLCVRPSQNLVVNLGFGSDATHTHERSAPAADLTHHRLDTTSLSGPAQRTCDKRLDSVDEAQWLRLSARSLFVLVFPKLHACIRHPVLSLRRWLR